MRQQITRAGESLLALTSVAALVESAMKRDVQLLFLSLATASALGLAVAARAAIGRSVGLWRWSIRLRFGQQETISRRLIGRVLLLLTADRAMSQLAYDSAWSPPAELSESLFNAREKGPPLDPLLAPVNLLERRSAWKAWAFSIGLTFDGVRFSARDRARRWSQDIEVHLEPDRYGIYNNAGKRFLKKRYGDAARTTGLKIGHQSRELLLDQNPGDVATVGSGYPLRWASGGVLPVVEWRKDGDRERDAWVALFFRDIDPVGWNVANGASESRHEQLHLDKLIEREFCEELLVLDADPLQSGVARQRQFTLRSVAGHAPQRIGSRAFSEIHRSLRKRHDKIDIGTASDVEHNLLVNVEWTPWRVVVTSGGRSVMTPDIVPSVNPDEFGIELIRVMRFQMESSDVLLDGEIIEDGPTLARRPVGLFRLSYLSRAFDGQLLAQADGDRRLLPSPTEDDFYLFDQDIDLRLARLTAKNLGDGEKRHITDWRMNFEDALKKRPLVNDDVRALCPVTWKTLEACFRKGVLR